MNTHAELCSEWMEWVSRAFGALPQWSSKLTEASFNHVKAAQLYWNGLIRYGGDFSAPSWNALNCFISTEKDKLGQVSPWENIRDYFDLLLFNMYLASRGLTGSLLAMNGFHLRKNNEKLLAFFNTVFGGEDEDLVGFTARQARLMELVVNEYPRAIRDIRSEYGLHFDNGGYLRAAETDRFELYQVLPLNKDLPVRKDGKPILIVPPYVLGPNILAFLPGEDKSYVHCFANQGTPTYIRIPKEIAVTPAVQTMTGEDDARDTRFFCEHLMAKHGRAVTLNGFCQGGFITLVDLLSGELDGVVDALITCVAPIDGTRSKALVEYMYGLPPRFRNMGFSTRELPNGNKVVDGEVMGWVYKLMSMDREFSISAFYRDLALMDQPPGRPMQISKTAAAINYWMIYDRTDLPLEITQMSFQSYSTPIDENGTLPLKLFGRPLNLKRLKEKGIPWLICIAEKDDLVDEAAALAPLDHIDAEVAVFPKGHGAIATSWSLPTSECALDSRFCHARSNRDCRGPVRYHLDLEQTGPVPSESTG